MVVRRAACGDHSPNQRGQGVVLGRVVRVKARARYAGLGGDRLHIQLAHRGFGQQTLERVQNQLVSRLSRRPCGRRPPTPQGSDRSIHYLNSLEQLSAMSSLLTEQYTAYSVTIHRVLKGGNHDGIPTQRQRRTSRRKRRSV